MKDSTRSFSDPAFADLTDAVKLAGQEARSFLSPGTLQGVLTEQSSLSATGEQATTARDAFKDYMAKTPEERLIQAELRKEGVTEDQLNALPPEERDAIMDRIKQAIEDRIKEGLANASPQFSKTDEKGFLTSISV